MPLIPSDSPNLPPLFDETPPTFLAVHVTHAFTSVCNVFDAKKRRYSQKSRKRQTTSEKLLKTSQNGGSSCHALPPSDLLQILTPLLVLFLICLYISSRALSKAFEQRNFIARYQKETNHVTVARVAPLVTER